MYRNILSISENITINKDWLYHWILNEEMMYKVYKFGILSKENLRKKRLLLLEIINQMLVVMEQNTYLYVRD